MIDSCNMMSFGYLPDFTPVNSVLERIGDEKKWSKSDIECDLSILARNRIAYVQDLRSLSAESWAQIELLPLVKDLLRGAIDPDYYTHVQIPVVATGKDDVELKKEKKEKKKDKKEKKKDKKKQNGFKNSSTLGTPVTPIIFNNSQHPMNDTSTNQSDSSLLSQDPLTIQNTLRNGGSMDESQIPTAINKLSISSNSSSSTEDEELIFPTRRKSVSFSNETAIGVAASETNSSSDIDVTDKKKKGKKDKKDKKDKKKNKENMASIAKCTGYNASHPYSYPIVKFRKMKMKHCKRLPEVPPNDQFLKSIHDRLKPNYNNLK